jgi:hypothetical protein
MVGNQSADDLSRGWQMEERLTLPPGRYEYKFIVDAAWTTDPAGTQEVPNAFGTTNSVVEVPGRRSPDQIDKPR